MLRNCSDTMLGKEKKKAEKIIVQNSDFSSMQNII